MRSNSFSWYSLNIPLSLVYILILLLLFKNDFKKAKNIFRNKKYNKDNCLKKHIEDIKENGLDIDNLDKYIISYDNSFKDFLIIGYVENGKKIVVKFVFFDDDNNIVSRLNEKCEDFFEEYSVAEVYFDLDDKMQEKFKKYNIDSVKRKNA